MTYDGRNDLPEKLLKQWYQKAHSATEYFSKSIPEIRHNISIDIAKVTAENNAALLDAILVGKNPKVATLVNRLYFKQTGYHYPTREERRDGDAAEENHRCY